MPCEESESEEVVEKMTTAEALFYLGLLTPEIEQELEVTVTAHQKAEWALEYAKRLEAAE